MKLVHRVLVGLVGLAASVVALALVGGSALGRAPPPTVGATATAHARGADVRGIRLPRRLLVGRRGLRRPERRTRHHPRADRLRPVTHQLPLSSSRPSSASGPTATPRADRPPPIDFSAPQDLPAGGQNPPQFDRLTRTTDLVTVGIGGNDAGIAGAGMGLPQRAAGPEPAPRRHRPAAAATTSRAVDRLRGPARRLQGEVLRRRGRQALPADQGVRAQAGPGLPVHRLLVPRARILAVDYLAIVPDHGWPPNCARQRRGHGVHPREVPRAQRHGEAGRAQGRRRVREHLHPDDRSRPLPAAALSGTARRSARPSTTPPSGSPRTRTPPAPAPRPPSSSTTCAARWSSRLRSDRRFVGRAGCAATVSRPAAPAH